VSVRRARRAAALPTLALLLGPVLPGDAATAFASSPAPREPSAAPVARTGAVSRRGDPVRSLEVWMQRRRRGRRPLDAEDEAELRDLLDDLAAFEPGAPERREEVAALLLSLAVLDLDWSAPRGTPPPGGFPERELPGAIAAFGERALRERLERTDGAAFADWLAREGRRPHEDDEERTRRVVALRLLAGRHVEGTMPELFAALGSGQPDVERAALGALSGWQDPRVDVLFLERLARGAAPRAVLEHFLARQGSLGPQARGGLRLELVRMLHAEDWREATRGVRLVDAVGAPDVVPLLIESLGLWLDRGERGEGSRRIAHEVTAQLERLSGRKLGQRVDLWRRWWKAVRDGSIDLAQDASAEESTVSSAQFFGLKPHTDRVVFVLDRSGSMEQRFGTGKSRYSQACHELFRFLELSGEDTRFDVVLFSDESEAWRGRPRRATPANLELLDDWLSARSPGGGTYLRKGIDQVVPVERDGSVPLKSFDVDTIVVLCDGATTEGPDWVSGWLQDVNDQAQLAFHCVQIGGRGDGTLERLAEGSGGDFVHVRR